MSETIQETIIWLSVVALIIVVVAAAIVINKWIDFHKERQSTQVKVAQEATNEARARAAQADFEYQKALLERIGAEIPPVKFNLSQEQLDALALEALRKRLAALKVAVNVNL